MVNRRRLFRALEKVQAWIPVDGYYAMGPGPRQSQEQQELAYPLSQCMSCGCCLEACPQYGKIELTRRAGRDRRRNSPPARTRAYDRNFVGAHAISQVDLLQRASDRRAERRRAARRADGAEAAFRICGNAQNCVAVCPKEIPLTTSIGRAGRQATERVLKKWFDR